MRRSECKLWQVQYLDFIVFSTFAAKHRMLVNHSIESTDKSARLSSSYYFD
jgi:hypothetical protein